MADFESIPINGTAEQLEKLLNMDIVESISEDSGNNEIPTAGAVFGFLNGQGNGGSVSYLPQELEDGQKEQARKNIDAATIDNTMVGADAWSSKNTVDKLCPTFTESGSVVTCEPVEGYPLEVTAEEGATQTTRCGKNLVVYPYDYKTRTINGITFTDNGDGSITIDGTATANATHFLRNQRAWDVKPGADYVGKLHVISGSGEMSWAVNYYKHGTVANYKGWLDVLMNKPDTKPCPDDMGTMATYLIVMAGKTCNNLVVRPQLEAGTTPTEYEPYREPETFAPGEFIPAIPGVNTIFADAGLVTVTGKANPSAIIEKLTNAILSLGGNV